VDDCNVLRLDRGGVCPACGRLLARGSGGQHGRPGQDVVDDFYARLLDEVREELERGVPEVEGGD